MSGLVIVGADGSASGLGAVEEAAAREARWRDAGLRIVHAFHWPVARMPLWQALPMPAEGEIRKMSEGCSPRRWNVPGRRRRRWTSPMSW